MKWFEQLGFKDEASAIAGIGRLNALANALADMTGQKDTEAMIGTVAAWQQASATDSQRKDTEAAHVTAAISGFDGPKSGLREAYDAGGVTGFHAALDKARAEQKEAGDMIGALCASGRLAPAAKASFDGLYKSHGLAAIKAAAASLPVASQVKTGEAPVAETEEVASAKNRFGLTDAEMEVCAKIGKDPEVFAKQKADLATADAKRGS